MEKARRELFPQSHPFPPPSSPPRSFPPLKVNDYWFGSRVISASPRISLNPAGDRWREQGKEDVSVTISFSFCVLWGGLFSHSQDSRGASVKYCHHHQHYHNHHHHHRQYRLSLSASPK
ncbi:hypothetical protein E2C01_060815 [Portunus trituberculatus]|uniref:Uncharacterized protein n=1 Tax=Portunus trituberculatus TaxID=210409 RepID=A0A5B7HDD5_PORTR|nr:hypothetical protein [Portunus trituberculatus]